MTSATERAVRDVFALGLRDDLAHSTVGIELGARVQGALTADVGDGATAVELIDAIRDACRGDAVAYARIMELVVLAGLDELQVIAGLPDSGITPIKGERPDFAQATPRQRR